MFECRKWAAAKKFAYICSASVLSYVILVLKLHQDTRQTIHGIIASYHVYGHVMFSFSIPCMCLIISSSWIRLVNTCLLCWQVVLNWLMAQGNVVPIPGAKNAEQAREFGGALGWRLTGEEVDELRSLASDIRPVVGFPVENLWSRCHFLGVPTII